ncbi:MAG: hypothetical protein ABI591_15210 [Kofleriaceae bacterium]
MPTDATLAKWRSWAITAILLGVVGGIGLCIYAGIHLGHDGLANAKCTATNCEVTAEAAHYGQLFNIGMFAGLGLVIMGTTAAIVLTAKKR